MHRISEQSYMTWRGNSEVPITPALKSSSLWNVKIICHVSKTAFSKYNLQFPKEVKRAFIYLNILGMAEAQFLQAMEVSNLFL